jgi:hypothetical protein
MLTGNMLNYSNLSILQLNNNQLSGTISDCSNSPQLQTLLLQNNDFSAPLPNFSPLSALETLYIYGNQLTFEGLEMNAVAGFTDFDYAPQDSIELLRAGDILYVANIGGTLSNLTYNWYLNDTLVASNIGENSYDMQESGYYRCEITNLVTPQLTLSTEQSLSPLVGINAFSMPLVATIYPSLSTGIIHIQAAPIQSAALRLNVFSMTGDLVHQDQNPYTQTLNLSHLPKGVYLVEINDSMHRLVKKVVLQ